MATYTFQIAGWHEASVTTKHYHGDPISTINEAAKNNIPSNAIVSSVQIHHRGSVSSGDTKFYIGFTNDVSKKPSSILLEDQLTTTNTDRYVNINSFSSTYPFNISASYSHLNFYASSGIIYKGFSCGGFDITYTFTIPTYTVTFKNYDGTILEQKQVEKGTTPSYTGATPASYIVDWQYANVFSGWDKAISAITADTTYTAVFTPALRKYYVDLTIINASDVVEDVNISGVYQHYYYNDTVTLAVDSPHIDVTRWTIRGEEIKEQSLTLKLDDETLQKYCLEIFMPETLTSYIVLAVDYTYKYYYIICEANPKEGGNIARQRQDGSYGTGSYWSQYGQKYNSTVNFLAKPNVGYSFIKWSDGATENPRAIAFTEDATYIAYFELDKIEKTLIDNVKPKKIFIDNQEVKAIYIDTTKVYG